MQSPEVSIIILNFNTYQLTSECIESIYEKTRNVSFEIILVDNASTQCDAENFKTQFPEIKLIKSDTNLGFAKGNNLGIGQSKGEYILLLNSDILLTENTIYDCLEQMKLDSKIGVLSPKLVYANGTAQSVANRFPSIINQLFILTRMFKAFSPLKKEKQFTGEFLLHDKIIEADWVLGAFFLTRKEIIESLENMKLSDNFFMFYEDVEWCYDIKKLGYKIIYYPFSQAIHYGSASFNEGKSDDDKADEKIDLIANNESDFLKRKKGWLYHKIYFFLWMLIYLSVRDFNIAKTNLKIMTGIS